MGSKGVGIKMSGQLKDKDRNVCKSCISIPCELNCDECEFALRIYYAKDVEQCFDDIKKEIERHDKEQCWEEHNCLQEIKKFIDKHSGFGGDEK